MEARLLLFPLPRYAFLLVQLTRSFPSYDYDEETYPGAMHTVDIREAREMAGSVGRSVVLWQRERHLGCDGRQIIILCSPRIVALMRMAQKRVGKKLSFRHSFI